MLGREVIYVRWLVSGLISLVKGWMRLFYKPRLDYVDASMKEKERAQPCVYIANHTSLKDALLMLSVLPAGTSALIAKDWYDKPMLHWFLKAAGCIPCDRYALDTSWLREARSKLQEGQSILVFPEGKTRKDGKTSAFKPGFAMLAATSGASVVCVAIQAPYRILRSVHIMVDTPIRLDKTKAMNSKYLVKQSVMCRNRVDYLKQMRR